MGAHHRHLKIVQALLNYNLLQHRKKRRRMASNNVNVLNKPLQQCSVPGSAMTGYTRTGVCENHRNDRGSHHVCINIDLPDGENFCNATGQPNWCDTTGPCHEDSSRQCKRTKWCVCQWAYAAALDKLQNGCDNISIDCSATSMRALESYDASPKYAAAAECIRQKCNL